MSIDRNVLYRKIRYEPHARQQEYHNTSARFTVPVCGRRFGKSTMAARKMLPEMFDEKKMFWIAGPTYDLAEKEFRVLYDDLIVKLGLGHEKRVKRRYNKKQGDMFIEMPWGARVECRSADHPENLVGEALHGVIMSEAAKHRPDTFERFIRPALADYRGWATFPTTPEGQNWLYQLWQLGRNPDPALAEYASWRFPSWENPYLYPGGRNDPEILLIERTTSPEWFAQEIGADFTAFVGKIYGEWEEDVHVQHVPYNPAWPTYIAFDWGYVNPLAAIEFQITPWDQVRVFREHYKAYETLPTHLLMLQQREQPDGYHLDLAFGDAADPEAVEEVSRSLVGCVSDPEAKSNWRDGIECVKSFLRLREMGTDEFDRPIEEPGLVVDHSCTNLIREFSNYKARAGTHGKNPTSPKELPQQIEDHGLDALRYALVHIYRLGALYHLEDTMSQRDLATSEQVSEGGYMTTGVQF